MGQFYYKMLTDTAILMCSIFPYRTLVSWLLLPPLFQLTMVEKETALTVSQVVATHILLLHSTYYYLHVVLLLFNNTTIVVTIYHTAATSYNG